MRHCSQFWKVITYYRFCWFM